MKRILAFTLFSFNLMSFVSAQYVEVKERLSDYFFNLPFNSGINTIKQKLLQNPEFKLHNDPNRDAKSTINGSFTKDKNLNPATLRNQVLIIYSPGTRKINNKISIKWTMHYRLEDLAIALMDLKSIKSEFKPYFENISEKEELGSQDEQILTTILEKDDLSLTIQIIKYNNHIHTISVECMDIWIIKDHSGKKK